MNIRPRQCIHNYGARCTFAIRFGSRALFLFIFLSRRLRFYFSFYRIWNTMTIDARTQAERDRQMPMLMLLLRHRAMTPCVRIRNIVRWRWWRSTCIVPCVRSQHSSSQWHCVFAQNVRYIHSIYVYSLSLMLLHFLWKCTTIGRRRKCGMEYNCYLSKPFTSYFPPTFFHQRGSSCKRLEPEEIWKNG